MESFEIFPCAEYEKRKDLLPLNNDYVQNRYDIDCSKIIIKEFNRYCKREILIDGHYGNGYEFCMMSEFAREKLIKIFSDADIHQNIINSIK